MKCAARASTLILAGFLAMTSTCVRAGGPGGRHGGSQLCDGSMYGLTDNWVKDGELHYMTTYGGQNSLPFERIDFEKTVQLNADRGVPFVLPPQSVPR
jgi:hypothetical protein